jgi:peptidoglycan/xylan/chitin deacetylase (PgdA/CDA1 family)
VYHYVRDREEGSRFPGIKGVTLGEFRDQVRRLAERYEMATFDAALDFLNGNYHPSKSLCLLTFDDGLKDHYRDVYPILQEADIQGLFFLTSRCLDGHVLAVHGTTIT